MVIFREAAWPCAIDIMKCISLFVATKMQSYDKVRCKKYFIVVKMTISICVNRKLFGMKSTKKGNRTLKRTFFFSLICSGPSPGSATTPSLVCMRLHFGSGLLQPPTESGVRFSLLQPDPDWRSILFWLKKSHFLSFHYEIKFP